MVLSLAVTPDGSLLASGSYDNTVRLWRLPDGAPQATLEGHTDTVYGLAVTPDRGLLASGDSHGTVRLWESRLARWWNAPVGNTRLEDVERALASTEKTDRARPWLELIAALVRWRRRFDVEIGAAAQVVSAGEFDIELGA